MPSALALLLGSVPSPILSSLTTPRFARLTQIWLLGVGHFTVKFTPARGFHARITFVILSVTFLLTGMRFR